MTPADPPSTAKTASTASEQNSSAPDDPAFDATFWKAVNAAFDEALESAEIARPAFIKSLHERDPRVSHEVRKLLGRAHAQTIATNVVRHTPTRSGAKAASGLTSELAPVLGDGGERGFDQLLHRALRAERSRVKDRRHAGELCGAWRLQEVIGVGGMGEVWLATRADGLYQAKAAVKFLRNDGDIERFEARFAQERALLARLNHPSIARLIDAGRFFGQPFLVLEYVDGQPLLNYVAEHASTVEARIELIREIGEAVSYAHSQLVVHRDLKPSNILVTPGGHVKLLDFGVAGLLDDIGHDEATTSEATKFGGRGLTVEYAAPEQISGEATGVASDIYSLGSLAYHLLSGRRAHLPEKTGRAALEYAVLHITPDRLSYAATHHDHATVKDNIPAPSNVVRLEGDVDAIINRAIRIDPADRYRTMEAFVADLTRWMEHRPISARREDRSYRTRLWLRRNWLPVGLTASLFVALVAGLALSLWQYDRARTEAARANQATNYLVDLFRTADPDLHGGEWPSAYKLIEQARVDVGAKFGDAPETQVRLNTALAEVFISLGRHPDALPLAEQAVAIATDLYGSNSQGTLDAEIALCLILARMDRGKEAVPRIVRLLPVAERAATRYPATYRNALLTAVNVYNDARQADLAEDALRRYAALIEKSGLTSPWETALIAGERAAILEVKGDLQASYAALKAHESIYLNPPPTKLKQGLGYLVNLVNVQMVVGKSEGLEGVARSLIAKWDALAGPTNRHSLEVLDEIAFFNMRHSGPEIAKRAYQERVDRFAQAPKINLNLEYAKLDVLEVDALYALVPNDVIAANFNQLLAVTEKPDASITPRRLFRFRWRLFYVAAVLNDIPAMEKLYAAAEAFITAGGEKIGSDANSLQSVKNGLAVAKNQLPQIAPDLYAAFKQRTLQRGAYYYFSFAVRTSILLQLAGHPEAAAVLTAAKEARPTELSESHRIVLAMRYAEALIATGSPNTAESLAARDRFAKAVGRQRAGDLPPELYGLFFY